MILNTLGNVADLLEPATETQNVASGEFMKKPSVGDIRCVCMIGVINTVSALLPLSLSTQRHMTFTDEIAGTNKGWAACCEVCSNIVIHPFLYRRLTCGAGSHPF